MFVPPPFHPRRPGLVAPVRVDPDGVVGPTRGQARGPRWRTTSHGFVVPAATPTNDPQQRTVEAAAVLRPGEAVTGWAALNWQRATWFSGTGGDGRPMPVPLVVAREVTGQPGLRTSQEFLRPADLLTVDGLAVSAPLRSLGFEMRHADRLVDAVVACDMAAYADLVSLAEVGRHIAAQMAPAGIEQARRALALADENSWSPRETLMRMVWVVLGERARPLCNVPIFDRRGRHVATPDLLDPETGVVGEYDGALHLVGSQRTLDLRREGELRALGLEVVVMVSGDGEDGYASFLGRLATAYARTEAPARPPRAWSIDPPPWWVPTTTVAARRALPPALRDRVLGYRRGA